MSETHHCEYIQITYGMQGEPKQNDSKKERFSSPTH
jgi:hypothetical protein